MVYPMSIPNHTPFIPHPSIIPNSAANSVAHIASRIIVNMRDIVPFPNPWNMYVEITPPGNTTKNHAKIWKKSTVGSNSLILVCP